MDGVLHIKKFEELSLMELLNIMRIRQEVFFLEQKVDCEEIDDADPFCTHMWEEENDRITGYLRLVPAGIVYKQPSIGRVLTRSEYRRNGISRRMMERAIDHIFEEWGGEEIVISAQAYLKDYYASLGFKTISDEYLDGGIPHYKMSLKI